METPESPAEPSQAAAIKLSESLTSRWRHWRASVRPAEPGALVAEVPPENLLRMLGDAQNAEGPGYRRLVDLTAVDHGIDADPHRFEMVYWLGRLEGDFSLRVRVALEKPSCDSQSESQEEAPEGVVEVDSIVSLWSSANWLEREVFDLFGIVFRGHPDLRRLLLPSNFEGAPLRKDYPRQPDLPLPKALEGIGSPETPNAPDPIERAERVEPAEAPGAGPR